MTTDLAGDDPSNPLSGSPTDFVDAADSGSPTTPPFASSLLERIDDLSEPNTEGRMPLFPPSEGLRVLGRFDKGGADCMSSTSDVDAVEVRLVMMRWLGVLPCLSFFSVFGGLLAPSSLLLLGVIGLSAESANRLLRLPHELSLLLRDMVPVPRKYAWTYAKLLLES